MSQIMELFHSMNGKKCRCGKIHQTSVQKIFTEQGALSALIPSLAFLQIKQPFLLADENTFRAAGEQVVQLLTDVEVPYTLYVLPGEKPAPDESTVGNVLLHYPADSDGIIAIGSGVINDTAKLLSAAASKPYLIVGTAPSMDGFASCTSSMDRDGLKVSLPTKNAEIIIGDTDILCNAPTQMLISGLGDMLAKYVSVCEWRISALINKEYYCEEIAKLVHAALDVCVKNAEGLINRQPAAVQAVFEGLVICGAAMDYAGLSRPASGVEHYFSHIWDMRALAFGTPNGSHGVQCAVATLQALKIYDSLRDYRPDKTKVLQKAAEFDLNDWNRRLTEFIGPSAKEMIRAEAKDGKYSREKHAKRLDHILDSWSQIQAIIRQELPCAKEFEALLDLIHCPKTPEAFGVEKSILPMTFLASKDIRDKYVLSRLCWDLGIAEEASQLLAE